MQLLLANETWQVGTTCGVVKGRCEVQVGTTCVVVEGRCAVPEPGQKAATGKGGRWKGCVQDGEERREGNC